MKKLMKILLLLICLAAAAAIILQFGGGKSEDDSAKTKQPVQGQENIQEAISKGMENLESLEGKEEELAQQAKQLYEEYGVPVVEGANDAINEAVESTMAAAARSFWESMKASVSDFFQNLFSEIFQ